MSSSAQASNTAQFVDRRKSQLRNHSSNHGWKIFLLIISAVLFLGYFITSSQRLYKPGDNIGYNMGLVGGLMLLSLLLYPLRKRVRLFRNLGILPAWFKWHMILGILAPTLILFHTTFHIGSINAAMALFSMLLVSGSGVFGRFFYTKIHNGLYGRQSTMNEMLSEMTRTDSTKATLSFVPEILNTLEKFRGKVDKLTKGKKLGLLNFATIGIQSKWLSYRLSKSLHKTMYAIARDKGWTSSQLKQLHVMYEENRQQIDNFIDAVRDVAQFHTYERLFSWWHIFHIPLVYLLIFSGIYHVISVHMY